MVELYISRLDGAEDFGLSPALTPQQHTVLGKHILLNSLNTCVAGPGPNASVTRDTQRTMTCPHNAIDWIGGPEWLIKRTQHGNTFHADKGAKNYFLLDQDVGNTIMAGEEGGALMWETILKNSRVHYTPNMRNFYNEITK